MLVNWKRRAFIILCFVLYYGDMASDVLYLLSIERMSSFTIFISLLSIQPGFYLIYYYLTLIIPVLCKDSTESIVSCIVSLTCRAPIYMLLCQFKLMLTPLYSLVSNDYSNTDRIKQSFLSYLLLHSLFESLPMTVYQFYLTSSSPNPGLIQWLSPSLSASVFLFSGFIINLIRKMNSGGLTWIQNPKPTLQFYSLKDQPTEKGCSLYG